MCDCLQKTKEMLKQHNTEMVTTIFGTPKAMIWTQQIESGRGKKKAVALIANHCPFCGARYETQPSAVEARLQ